MKIFSKFLRIDTVFYAVLLIIILFTYKGLFKTFFQQDEWASMGIVLGHNTLLANFSDYSIVQLLAGNGRVLGSFITVIFDRYFPFEVAPFVLFALITHWLNALLTYGIVKRITRNKYIGFLSALVFATLYESSGALTWISAHTTALPNCLFLLLSMYLYFKYLDSKKNKYKFFSYVSFIVSLLFKESSLFMIVEYPLLDIIFNSQKKNILLLIKQHVVVFVYCAFMVISRYVQLKSLGANSGVFVTKDSNVFTSILLHAASYPVTSFSQTFIPSQLLFKVASYYQMVSYSFLNTHPLQTAIQTIIVSDILSTWLTLILLLGLGILWFISKKERKFLLFCVLFLFLSFLPFIAIDKPFSSYLDSRYYYIASVGAAMIVGAYIAAVVDVGKRYSLILQVILASFSVIVVLLFCWKNTQFIRRDITQQIFIADDRKNFLNQVKTLFPEIPNKPIFYVTGDSPGFYGLANLTIPFQQGFGYTLMVWYWKSGKIPAELLNNFYLWNLYEEGYKEENGKGFGFFWKKDDLIKAFRSNPNLRQQQVIGLFYKGSTKDVMNITDQIREELQ